MWLYVRAVISVEMLSRDATTMMHAVVASGYSWKCRLFSYGMYPVRSVDERIPIIESQKHAKSTGNYNPAYGNWRV